MQLYPVKCIDLFYKDQYDVNLNLNILEIDKENKFRCTARWQQQTGERLKKGLSFLPFFYQNYGKCEIFCPALK